LRPEEVAAIETFGAQLGSYLAASEQKNATMRATLDAFEKAKECLASLAPLAIPPNTDERVMAILTAALSPDAARDGEYPLFSQCTGEARSRAAPGAVRARA
jgi:hypothetical protein